MWESGRCVWAAEIWYRSANPACKRFLLNTQKSIHPTLNGWRFMEDVMCYKQVCIRCLGVYVPKRQREDTVKEEKYTHFKLRMMQIECFLWNNSISSSPFQCVTWLQWATFAASLILQVSNLKYQTHIYIPQFISFFLICQKLSILFFSISLSPIHSLSLSAQRNNLHFDAGNDWCPATRI